MNNDLLDFEKLNSKNKIKIGELTQEIIDILGISRKPCNIVMWAERLKHTAKHKINFRNEEEYIEALKNIPNIIKNADYVGLHPTDNSIQYIKRLNKIMLVGIRLKSLGELSYRTTYPITESQLNDYLRKGRIKKLCK